MSAKAKSKAKPTRIKWLSSAAASRVLEQRARRVLGVSAAEFRKQLKAGKYAGLVADRNSGVLALATLCSFTGKHRARKNRTRSS